MAKKVILELIDDFDGKSKAEETVSFSLDGVEYEIDLSNKNARKLRSAFEQWTDPARKVGRIPRQGEDDYAGHGRPAEDGRNSRMGENNGYNVSSRGRIQADIIEAYNKAS
ncbi:histone-like nucleoid-structuring protein Lsr2 [Nocardia veterana]|uniref:Lsr2 family protein n=1 Tax=Nocardia veterana TaxID=132249 RepID=A0A7X6M1M0_9NOCA|nr:Lsr2 family protein [Nocardia veterana]NKY87760.1 Lsr2 family protein [Nocardia veterana]